MDSVKSRYDAIIIGAGIGGLICGCYLAKKGVKTLIVEKNSYVGGYCCSFERNAFVFDAAAHSLGSCRKTGHIGKVIKDLGLDRKVRIIRHNPSDIIQMPGYKVSIMNDADETISHISKIFPEEEKNIKNFINFITNSSFPQLFLSLNEVDFDSLLKMYFKSIKLRTLFKILTGSLYVPTGQLSALSASVLLKEFVFDGGYYPKGGMWAFSNAVCERFKEMGGELLLSCPVTKIKTKNNRVQGVCIGRNFIPAKHVISNCDARETFLTLLDSPELVGTKLIRILKKLKVSASFFAVYLGIKQLMRGKIEKGGTYWFIDTYDIDSFFARSQSELIFDNTYLICSFPSFSDHTLAPSGGDSLCVLTGAPFRSESFWKKNKLRFADSIIEKLGNFLPQISSSIVVKESASPLDFWKYTLNSKGSFRGWASLIGQGSITLIPPRTKITGLFLTGHWLTYPEHGGIPMVVNSGRTTAELVLKRVRKCLE